MSNNVDKARSEALKAIAKLVGEGQITPREATLGLFEALAESAAAGIIGLEEAIKFGESLGDNLPINIELRWRAKKDRHKN